MTRPLWAEGQETVAPRHAPAVGEHSAAVLREAGCAEGDIDAMRAAGVIG